MVIKVTTIKGDNVDLKKLPRGSLAYCQLEAYKAYADKKALVDEPTGDTLTYAQLTSQIKALYHYMRLNELAPQDVVCICSQNIIQYPVALSAALLGGGTAMLLPPEWRPADILKEVQDSRARFLVCSAKTYGKVRDTLSKMKRKPNVILISSADVSNEERKLNNIMATYSEIIRMHEADSERLPISGALANDQKDAAVIVFTAGTTGKPKGVKLSHLGLTGTCVNPQSKVHEAATQRTSTLASLPFASAFALRTTLLQPLFLGQEVRVLPSPYYDVEALANAVAGNKIQHLYAVPDLISELLSSPSTIRFDLTCVKSITCTSSELRPAVERGLYTLFKGLEHVNECYSSVETGIVAVAPVEKEKWPRPVGVVEPGFECKVVQLGSGLDMGSSDRGELCIRSPFMMLDYYPDDVISEQGYDEFGWYHTGDYGFYDENGNLYRLARIRELIRASDGLIVPSEIEELILQHPEVRDVTVVAVADKETGAEVPRAYITPAQGVNMSAEKLIEYEKQIIEHVEAKTTNPTMLLKGGVSVSLRLPRTSRDFGSAAGSGRRVLMHAK